jgi:Tol biopolymer transport system component
LEGATSQIWALDERSNMFHKPSPQPIALTSGPIEWGIPVFSKDGKQIFCTGSTSRGELIRFAAKSKQFQPFIRGISANLLSFSRDGRTVAYSTYPDHILWKSRADGTDRVQLTDATVHPESVSMSPDGSQVLFMSPFSKSDVIRAYLVSSQGEGARLLVPNGTGPETDPNWSPDGRKIVFGTDVLNGKTIRSDIRILDVDTQQLSILPNSAGKVSPRWAPNGHFLLAASLLLLK